MGETKAWVIDKADASRKRIAAVVEPVHASLARVADSSMTNAVAVATFVKCKTMGVVTPVQVRIHNGVLYVQAVIANTYVAFSTKATSTWSSAVVYSTRSYEAVTARMAAVSQRGCDVVNAGRLRMYKAVQPTLMKAQDGCLYVQTVVGNAVVNIKVGVLGQQRRIAAFAPRVNSNVFESVNGLTAPVIERILAVYEQARTRLAAVCGPYLHRLQGICSGVRTQVDGVVVTMKVRTATTRELAMKYPSMCYVKVKGSCFYLYEIVGDKVVGIKVQLNEILAKMNAVVGKLAAETQVRIETVKDHLCSRAVAVAKGVKNAANDRSVQATAAGSIGGSTALAASGGATGLATGSMVGAACGLIPAVFTCGLSIPIGAAIGGSTGLVAGTVAGGAVGLVGGGVAGRTAHKHREQIGDGVAAVANKASELKAAVQEKSSGCLDRISGKVNECKTSVVGARISAAW